MIGPGAIVQVTVLLVFACGGLVLLRRRSAAVRHWTLTSLLAAALMAPFLSSVVPGWSCL